MEVEKQTHDVEFRTSDVGALCSLMYALQDLKKVVRFYFDVDGIEIKEGACRGDLCIYAKFDASRFSSYKSNGPGMICFLPKYLYIVLSSHNQRDEVFFSFDHKDDSTLFVQVLRDGNEEVVQEYHLPLLLTDEEPDESALDNVDYLLAFDTTTITGIFSCLIGNEKEFNDDWVRLTCEPKKVTFLMQDGISISHARFTLFTDQGKQINVKRHRRNKKENGENSRVETSLTRSVHQNTVNVHFRLQHIHQMLKCFSINRGSIVVYVKEDSPIMFEISVGMLGKLRLTLFTKEAAMLMEQDDTYEYKEVSPLEYEPSSLMEEEEDEEEDY